VGGTSNFVTSSIWQGSPGGVTPGVDTAGITIRSSSFVHQGGLATIDGFQMSAAADGTLTPNPGSAWGVHSLYIGLAANGTIPLSNGTNLELGGIGTFWNLDNAALSVNGNRQSMNGGGGNLCAYARGFDEVGAESPRFVAGEAAERATTVASAIRISDPVHAPAVGDVMRASNGLVVSLPDEAILRAWRELALEEGLFCEPASAAGLAALEDHPVERGARVVCVVTGHGLKDPEAAARLTSPPVIVDANADAIAEAAI